MSQFHYFDHIYCIHKPDTTRRETIEQMFAKIGAVGVEYVYADRPHGSFEMSNMRRAPKYEFAVNLSHSMAIAHAIADGAKRPLFVEDDIVFSEDAGEVLEKALKALPDDWDVMYMGGHPCEDVERISPNLVKIGRFSFAESYTINGVGALKRFLDFWYNSIGQPQAMYDFILSRFAMDNGYCTYPVLTHQPPGYSHISQGKDSKLDLVTRGWANHCD